MTGAATARIGYHITIISEIRRADGTLKERVVEGVPVMDAIRQGWITDEQADRMIEESRKKEAEDGNNL